MRIFAPILIVGSLLFGWSDMTMADDDCLATWRQNPVNESCKAYASAFEEQNEPLMVDLGNGQCRLKVVCKNQYGGGTPNPRRLIDKEMLVQLRNCNGELQLDPC